MSPTLQSILALAIVALTVIWLVRRSVVQKKSGCGGGCGCPASEVKAAAEKVKNL